MKVALVCSSGAVSRNSTASRPWWRNHDRLWVT